jgi:hypothetical protein
MGIRSRKPAEIGAFAHTDAGDEEGHRPLLRGKREIGTGEEGSGGRHGEEKILSHEFVLGRVSSE